MEFYEEYRQAAVVDGNITKVVQKFKEFEFRVIPIIEELAGMGDRSAILAMLCSLCVLTKKEVDSSGVALWNAVVCKQKENVAILLGFGSCYRRIQFDTDEQRTQLYECLSDMNLEVDCNQKHCKLCNEIV